MRRVGKLELTTPNDREIVMTRTFAAPGALVWEAYTRPEHLQRWLGVHNGWTFPECPDLDPRWRLPWQVWPSPALVYEMAGYGRGLPRNRARFPDFGDGHREVRPRLVGGRGDRHRRVSRRSGVTTLTMRVLYDTKAIRDAVLRTPMESGVAAGFDTLPSGSPENRRSR